MNKNPKQILIELDHNFKNNFKSWNGILDPKIEKVFLGLECVAAIGQILEANRKYKHHDICCKIYDEIFADGVSAIYFATIAMDKPARIVLRRMLELGVASVYLWDMPHMVYSWKSHDQDLSFSEMLNHICSKGFLSYIKTENIYDKEIKLLSKSRCQEIYGDLSDVVHGKISTFESVVPDRFKFIDSDWREFVVLIEEIIIILVKFFIERFNLSEDLFREVPRAKIEFK